MITYSLDYYFNRGALHFVNYFENTSFLSVGLQGNNLEDAGITRKSKIICNFVG